jgi:hypothetical protein
MITINLQQYRIPNSKILSGRDFGIQLRQKLELDKIDNIEEQVTIIIPSDIWALNSSYFIGVFGKSILMLGEEKFRKKYLFQCSNNYVLENIEQGIEDILL